MKFFYLRKGSHPCYRGMAINYTSGEPTKNGQRCTYSHIRYVARTIICRTRVEEGVSDVGDLVSDADGVDVASIGGPTAINCASGFSTALTRRFLGCGSGDWSGVISGDLSGDCNHSRI
jgi:hypothetical protein